MFCFPWPTRSDKNPFHVRRMSHTPVATVIHPRSSSSSHSTLHLSTYGSHSPIVDQAETGRGTLKRKETRGNMCKETLDVTEKATEEHGRAVHKVQPTKRGRAEHRDVITTESHVQSHCRNLLRNKRSRAEGPRRTSEKTRRKMRRESKEDGTQC